MVRQDTDQIRLSGKPTSPNGASSLHLVWDTPESGALREVSAVLTIDQMPQEPAPRFWALQASAYDLDQPDQTNGRGVGGAHLGLSYERGDERGVSWAGYDERKLASGEDWIDARLDATLSEELDVADPDDAFRHYGFPWLKGEAYRLLIEPTPGRDGWFRGSVTELSTNKRTVVSDLDYGGDLLGRISVWSEVFAPCDAPPASVVWSDFQGLEPGSVIIYRPRIIKVNYQSFKDGGCGNTNVEVLPGGSFRQVTNTVRTLPQGTEVAV